jgi:glycosyltransferase involved in cell wall biosynthesis
VGLVAVEAAAYGAGVVITKNGGPPDYFGDLAYYVDQFDVASIRHSVQKAWENPKSEAIKRHVLTNLTWEQSARSLVAAFQRHRN